MASSNSGLTSGGLLLRFIAAVVLVFGTYNPEGAPYSYFEWALRGMLDDYGSFSVLKGFVGMILLIGWTVYLRATLRSLGAFGLSLAIGFFGMLLWLIVDLGLVPADSVRAVSYLVLVGLCGVLTAGISWSHIRRRLTGQIDTDDIEGDS